MYTWNFYNSKSKTIFDLVWIEKGKEELVETFDKIAEGKVFQKKYNLTTANSLDDFYKQQKNDIDSLWNGVPKKSYAIILHTKNRPRYKDKRGME
jgi:hypothetical protein